MKTSNNTKYNDEKASDDLHGSQSGNGSVYTKNEEISLTPQYGNFMFQSSDISKSGVDNGVDDSIGRADRVVGDDQKIGNQKKMKPKHANFSNSITFFLSALGCAVGTGNVWRFSRIVAMNGGPKGAGCFLIQWITFLFLWSIPLIITEYAIGRKTRKAVIGTFHRILGSKFIWMGIFIFILNVGIMFYYGVICGWVLYYLIRCILFELPGNQQVSTQIWTEFEHSYWPVLFHVICVMIGGICCIKGVKTIEKVNIILVPGLIVVIIGCFIRACFVPDSWKGLKYFFYPDLSVMLNPQSWLDALTQNAFDTSAGWTIFIAYANHITAKTQIVKLGTLTPMANNSVSLISGMTTFMITYAVLGTIMSEQNVLQVMKTSGPAGTGITFIWFPILFSSIPLGRFIAIFFFFGLTFAAISSLIAMMNMPIKVLCDMGVNIYAAVFGTTILTIICGLPSSLSVSFFANQDHVWGSALVFSGFMILLLVLKMGPKKFRLNDINKSRKDIKLGRWFDLVICVVTPILCITLVISWIISSIFGNSEEKWYNPIGISSLMTCLVQWCIALVLSIVINVVFIFVMWKRKNKESHSGNFDAKDNNSVKPDASTGNTKSEI